MPFTVLLQEIVRPGCRGRFIMLRHDFKVGKGNEIAFILFTFFANPS